MSLRRDSPNKLYLPKEISDLCQNYHIILLQETWLTKQTLDKLNDISDFPLSAGTYVIDCADGVINGRPHGGTAILWRKALDASIF